MDPEGSSSTPSNLMLPGHLARDIESCSVFMTDHFFIS
ncbi:hypothetical protein A33Q_0914 [Indibacter alkaliphilus LW1]|uniref:Uncharacterized protein n=1 Tax=Indibacter alkaliphilus (strain CCUG 57479 / KCTC 22604 / LW1) TaxID=1189612 RepID=S2E355_INDAL|nr:hypothetical protein A33Q_0914 [Indibacter alkaliphilus LW1]